MEKIRILKITTPTGILETEEIENTIEAFHKVLRCETLSALSVTELGRYYGLDIYFDDNGKLFGQDTITGLFVHDNEVVDTLVGNLLICRHDEEGDSSSTGSQDFGIVSTYMHPRSVLGLNKRLKDNYGTWEVADMLLLLPC